MGLGILQKKGGSSRKYIFKDGVFKITPTTNQGTIQSDGTWKGSSNGAFLQIPYEISGEMVFAEVSGDPNRTYVSLLTDLATDYQTSKNRTTLYGTLDPNNNNFTVLGISSYKKITVTGKYDSSNLYTKPIIKSIWTEKIGGGSN